MGGGASKKKPQGQEEKPPVWVDNLDGTTFGEDGTTYTGLTRMGLVRLKPHLVGRLTYISGETGSQEGDGLDDAVSEIGGCASDCPAHPTQHDGTAARYTCRAAPDHAPPCAYRTMLRAQAMLPMLNGTRQSKESQVSDRLRSEGGKPAA
jgi:hypothetical protein